jgi:hypothetical protein
MYTATLVSDNIVIDPLRQKCSGRLPVHMLTHDVANKLSRGCPMLEPERVRLAERWAHRDILFL